MHLFHIYIQHIQIVYLLSNRFINNRYMFESIVIRWPIWWHFILLLINFKRNEQWKSFGCGVIDYRFYIILNSIYMQVYTSTFNICPDMWTNICCSKNMRRRKVLTMQHLQCISYPNILPIKNIGVKFICIIWLSRLDEAKRDIKSHLCGFKFNVQWQRWNCIAIFCRMSSVERLRQFDWQRRPNEYIYIYIYIQEKWFCASHKENLVDAFSLRRWDSQLKKMLRD